MCFRLLFFQFHHQRGQGTSQCNRHFRRNLPWGGGAQVRLREKSFEIQNVIKSVTVKTCSNMFQSEWSLLRKVRVPAVTAPVRMVRCKGGQSPCPSPYPNTPRDVHLGTPQRTSLVVPWTIWLFGGWGEKPSRLVERKDRVPSFVWHSLS